MTMKNQIYDLIGIGFGPANLAIAIAAQEMTDQDKVPRMLFFDIKEDFSWHPGMLLETSRLQVVFLKDLVTMRNPRSQYTFLNYLLQVGRLHEFINLRSFYPSRIEFDKYYRWVADQFRHLVDYRTEVLWVAPEENGGEVNVLRVGTRDLATGKVDEFLTKSLTVATGGTPRIPNGISLSSDGRVFHSSDCLHCLNAYYKNCEDEYHFLVVGSGQTAVDIVYYLVNRYPNAQITGAFRGFAYKPQDDTYFVNELFFPEVVDLFYTLPDGVRQNLWSRHSDVTHSAADMDLLPLLYDAYYQSKVTESNRLNFMRFSELTATETSGDSVLARFRNTMSGSVSETSADALILATGYDRKTPIPLLRQVNPWLEIGSNGNEVERFYAIRQKEGFTPHIYPLGFCEPTHGFSEILLSLLPLRSQEVLDDIIATIENSVTENGPLLRGSCL